MKGPKYREYDFEVSNRKFSYFDSGRETESILSLITSKPKKINWQKRAILDRLVRFVRNTDYHLDIYLNVEWEQLARAYINFVYSYVDKDDADRIRYFVANSSSNLDNASLTNLGRELADARRYKSFDVEMLEIGDSKSDVMCLGVISLTAQLGSVFLRAAMDLRRSYVLVEDYCYPSTKIPVDELRRRNLVIVESVEGYGELLLLKS